MKSGEIELSGLLNSNLSLAHVSDFASLDDHRGRGGSENDHGGRGRLENDQKTITAAANDQKRSRRPSAWRPRTLGVIQGLIGVRMRMRMIRPILPIQRTLVESTVQ
jgi:hypothetical protein